MSRVMPRQPAGTRVPRQEELSARLKKRGVLIDAVNASLMRLVTHYDVDREGCELALAALAEVAAGLGHAPLLEPSLSLLRLLDCATSRMRSATSWPISRISFATCGASPR